MFLVVQMLSTITLLFGHYDADGIMDDSNLRRETLRSNLESNINKWLKSRYQPEPILSEIFYYCIWW